MEEKSCKTKFIPLVVVVDVVLIALHLLFPTVGFTLGAVFIPTLILCVLSTLGRHTPANLEAFQGSLWSDEEKELLLQQWQNVVEVPEIPGGYYVSRNIDNAFRQVFYNGENARDTLNYWMNAVDEELARKQLQLAARKGDLICSLPETK